MRLRRVDGASPEGPSPPAGVEGGPALPERFPLPRRRVVHGDAGSDAGDTRAPRRRAPGSDPGGRVPRRPDQDGGCARARHAPRPLPADRGVHRLDHGHRLRSGRADGPGRQRHAWRPGPHRRMSNSFDFPTPDLFTAGTIGPPGQRVFYLQARQEGTLVTLKCEKEQVRVLGEYLARLLERLSTPPPAAGGDLALVEPVTPAWVVGSIGVGYDEGADQVVLVIEEVAEQEEDSGEEPSPADEEPRPETEPEPEPEEPGAETESDRASGRLRLTRPQVAAFVERARGLIEAGRPTCR